MSIFRNGTQHGRMVYYVNMKKSSDGFTLIELLVSIGIIGLLSTVVAASVGIARAQARNVKRKVEARAMLDAILQYQPDHNESLPPGIDGTSRQIGTAASGCSIACGLADPDVIEVTLTPIADSYIYQYAPAQNYGTQPDLQIYPWNIGYNKRALVRFDLSSIPMDSTIVSATLSLKETATYGVARTIALHRATRDWTEASVSWNRYNALNPWTTPGGDFSGSASAAASVTWWPSAQPDWDTWDVTPDVLAFVNGTTNNYGWVVKDANEDSSQQYWYFSSREGTSAPTLTIRYSATAVGSGVADACLDLKPVLTPDYITRIPKDPRYGSDAQTYYVVRKSVDGQVYVRACGAELGETIVAQGS